MRKATDAARLALYLAATAACLTATLWLGLGLGK